MFLLARRKVTIMVVMIMKAKTPVIGNATFIVLWGSVVKLLII